MSIHGINNVPGGAGWPGELGPSRPERERAAGAGAAPARPTDAGPASEGVAAVRERQASVPTEPPPGTDPKVWSVLTAEERAFFAQHQRLGPLTYGPGQPSTGTEGLPPRGGRIDVRV